MVRSPKARLDALPLRWRFMLAPALGLVLLTLLTIGFVSELRLQGALIERVAKEDLGRFNRFAALSLQLSRSHTALFGLLDDARQKISEEQLHDEATARLDEIRHTLVALRAALAGEPAAHGGGPGEGLPEDNLLRRADQYQAAAKQAVDVTTVDVRNGSAQLGRANEAYVALNSAFNVFLDRHRADLRAEMLAKADQASAGATLYGAAAFAVALFLLAFSVVAARVFARSLEHQLDALVRLGREAGVVAAAPAGGTEIDRIAAAIAAFRAATLRLREKEEAQRALNGALEEARATLERRVQARTRELSAANEELSKEVAERAEAERALVRASRSYAALSETNKAILHVTDRERLYRAVCRIAVEEGGIGAACVSLIDGDSRRIRPLVRAGDEALQDIALAGEANAIRAAVLADRPYIANDLAREESLDALPGRTNRSGAWFPLFQDGRAVAVLTLLCRECDVFDAQVIALLGEMVDNISFALDNIERERARVAAEQALRLRQRAVEASVNAIAIASATRPGYPLEYVNPAYEAITGYAASEVIGRGSVLLEGGDRSQPGIEHLRAAMRERREGRALLRNHRKDGRLFWNDVRVAPVRDDSGQVTHFVGVINDVTEAKKYQEQLEHQANHDALTGLPNRNLLRDRVEQAIAYAQRQGRSVALAMLDLDHFKTVNDSLGHTAGDELLATAARRIQSCLRASDTLARLGGDEFVLVMPNLGEVEGGRAAGNDDARVAEALRRIQATLAEPMMLCERRFHVTCSIGVSRFPHDAQTIDALLQQADAAMYEAKAQGRARFHFYSADLNTRISRRLDLEAGMRLALERGEFALHFQPKLDLSSGRIVGAEALLRWTSPERGSVSPAEFIPLAEETGLIVPIGDWVLQAACAQIAAWRGTELGALTVSVNLSPRQLRSAELLERIDTLLARHALPSSLLELEITETAMAEDPERMRDLLRSVTARGIRLSIDDFGTGYSSLAYLKRFRASTLKIDRAFIRDIVVEADDAALTSAMIAMAKDLGMRTVAEGVETAAQMQRLRQLGCDEIQGYLVSPALPAPQFEKLVSEREKLARSRAGAEGALPAVGLRRVL